MERLLEQPGKINKLANENDHDWGCAHFEENTKLKPDQFR